MIEKRKCIACKEDKMLGFFPKRNGKAGGHIDMCADCHGKKSMHGKLLALKAKSKPMQRKHGTPWVR